MVDEIPFPTQEERRQRKKQLQCARRRTRNKTTAESPIPANAAVSDTAPTADAPPAKGRGRPKRPDVTAADVTGLNCFEKLRPLLERLHDVGCERDKAGNRDLHCDEFCLLMLLGGQRTLLYVSLSRLTVLPNSNESGEVGSAWKG